MFRKIFIFVAGSVLFYVIINELMLRAKAELTKDALGFIFNVGLVLLFFAVFFN
jgi:hypothetical protein